MLESAADCREAQTPALQQQATVDTQRLEISGCKRHASFLSVALHGNVQPSVATSTHIASRQIGELNRSCDTSSQVRLPARLGRPCRPCEKLQAKWRTGHCPACNSRMSSTTHLALVIVLLVGGFQEHGVVVVRSDIGGEHQRATQAGKLLQVLFGEGVDDHEQHLAPHRVHSRPATAWRMTSNLRPETAR